MAMVDDVVNDAPAMAHAALGVARRAAGSDLALENRPCRLAGRQPERSLLRNRIQPRDESAQPWSLFLTHLACRRLRKPTTAVRGTTMRE